MTVPPKYGTFYDGTAALNSLAASTMLGDRNKETIDEELKERLDRLEAKLDAISQERSKELLGK